ncbi:MAG: hypothetical protein Q8Q07_01035, partial [Dehalococcoidales bacterium]|nr:hypothetical protein [Dehalococcoidales bacterium]
GYLDYTTLDNRHFFCLREVELNQRLCPDTYLGVVSITGNDGDIRIEGKGRALEYAVKMRHLPREGMMNVLLDNGLVTTDMVDSVARILTDFHRKAETGENINRFGEIEVITGNVNENFDQTIPYIDKTISRETYRSLKKYTIDFIENNGALFRKRITDGRIRDCHGDLHTAHICFARTICIYDCIEFNDRFRYCDVASEVAFLAMDLDHYRRPDLSRSFVNAYVTLSHDDELYRLLNFYKCYRAYVRGKVEGFKLDAPLIAEEEKEKITTTAREYFELAESYIG